MEPKGVEPKAEGTGIPSMMQEMMKKMCCGGEVDPAAMCREMMASAGRTRRGRQSPKRRAGTPRKSRRAPGR